MTTLAACVIAGLAFIAGWVLRGALDRAVLTIVTRVLTSAIGREKAAEAFQAWTQRSSARGG